MATLPPLPKIEGDVDLFLDVFTHKSLRMVSAPMNEEYGNTERLAELGASALRLAVATHFFRKKPQLNAEEIRDQIELHLTDATIDAWMAKYNLKTKLRIAPAEMNKINDLKEMRKVFETYVGALFIRNGLPSIEPWVSRLIDPDAPDSMVSIPTSYTAPTPAGYNPPAPTSYPSSSTRPGNMAYAPPAPKSPPPPIPPPYSMGSSHFQSPSQGSQMYNMVTVALMNQKATQMGYLVTYPAEHTGPPHNPLWTVRCCLNNREYGRGTGKSQKIAKDEAARKTWAAMGW